MTSSNFSRFLIPATLIFVVGLLLGSTIKTRRSPDDMTDQLKKLEDAYSILTKQYVDDIDTGRLSEKGILGMLEELDPHSTYIPASHISTVREGYEGSFGGIGIWYEVVADTPRVNSTVSAGPSEAVGVSPGDRIIRINGVTSTGDSSRTVQARLKGPIGTTVDVTLVRRGVADPLEVTITRDKIPLYSIDTAYMIDDETGFIRIDRFAVTTYREFMEKVSELQSHGMKRMILDLRSNPGGVMEAAVKIADEFLAGPATIVETRSRHTGANRIERADTGDTLESMPLIVLIDDDSASASEIIAGALQDHDRALIVGQRSFGKALVQQQFELTDGSVLHMTVSRYYTPSGRLIQTPYNGADLRDYLAHKFDDRQVADVESLPDSLQFQTTHGRTVPGGGGIFPDHLVLPDSMSPLLHPLAVAILGPNLDISFSRDLFDREQDAWNDEWKGRRDDFLDEFQPSQDLIRRFWLHAADRGVRIAPGAFSEQDRAFVEPVLRVFLKGRIAQKLYGTEAWYPAIRLYDPELTAALELWLDAESLAANHGWER